VKGKRPGPMESSHGRARTVVTLVGALVVAAAVAAPAGAAVRTSVTEPADGFSTIVTGTGDARGPHFTARGSSNLRAGVTVSVICDARGTAMPVGTTVTRAGGAWSLEVGSADAPFPRGACRLRALPPVPGTDLSRYGGPRISVTQLVSWPSEGGLYDAGLWASHARAYVDAFSAGDCGLCDMALEDAMHGRRSRFLFYGNGAIPGDERARYGSNRAFLRVDGHDARLPAAAHAVPELAGAPRLAVRALAPDRLGTLEPVARCTSQDATPAAAGCGRLVASGLVLARTLRVLGDGTRVRITDSWRSADGATHALDVDYEQQHATDPGDELQCRATWAGGAFGPAIAERELPPPPTGPVSLLVRSKTAPQGSFQRPAGAITFDPAPRLLRFGDDAAFIARYRATVQPGHPVVITQHYAIARSVRTAARRARHARRALRSPRARSPTDASGPRTSRR
jgi:hypothetical protein